MTDEASTPENLVVILGAGFSRSVFDSFPTTDELGEAVRARLTSEDQARLPEAKFGGGRFEEWLSYLTEPQPHFDQVQSYEAAALAIRLTRTIANVLTERQREVLMKMPPPWFYEFLSVLHVTRPDVLTLNYDNLVECGVVTMELQGRGRYGPNEVSEDDILAGLPAYPELHDQAKQEQSLALMSGAPYAEEGRPNTLRLLKLHGSLTWYWLPEGGGSSSLRRWQLPGMFGDLWDPVEEHRRQALPRHEIFIVPPAALKGQRLHEPVARELWHRAAEALKESTRLVLVGYSVPVADHSVSGMLADGIVGRNVQVEVVNPCPDPVVDRLIRLGVPKDSISPISGAECVANWTSGEVDRLAAIATNGLREGVGFDGDELLFLDSPRENNIWRIDTDEEHRLVRLVLNPKGQQLTRPKQFKDIREPLAAADSCVVDIDGRDLPVIDYWIRPEQSGSWMAQLHLVVAGR